MSVVYSLITVIHVLVCFVLILVVLLQAGKGGGMAGLFGGGGDTIFGGQGPTKPMAILTAFCAALFMITCITLSIMTKSTAGHSVIQNSVTQQQQVPVQHPAQTPKQTVPTNTNPAPSTPPMPAQQPTNSK